MPRDAEIIDKEALERRSLLETSQQASAVAWDAAVTTGAGDNVGEAAGDIAKVIAASANGLRCAVLALELTIRAATAPPAVDVEPIQEAPRPPLAGWAYVELMGRRVLPACWVEEDDLVGRSMLRIRRLVKADRPAGVGEPAPPLELEERFRIYSPATVYSLEWITETEARERWLSWNGSQADDDIPF